MSRDAAITRIFNAGGSYKTISEQLGIPLGTAASSCKRLGLRRNAQKAPDVISAEERAEREQDHRDLDMLSDLREGHSLRDVAEHWGVTTSHVNHLRRHARGAA